MHWRKGVDYFLLAAKELQKRGQIEKFHFTWIGKISTLDRLIYEEDLRKSCLQNHINFSGELENPIEEFTKFDAFLLTSKEDPFPLVAIEVAFLGVPIICFDQGTGTKEFVEKGAGIICPYMDIAQLADSLIYLLKNNGEREKMANKAKELTQENNIEVKGLEVYESIRKFLS